MNEPTIRESITDYLKKMSLERNPNTTRTYNNGIKAFLKCLQNQGIDPDNTPVSQVSDSWITAFVSYTKNLSPSTEGVYIASVIPWYEYLVMNHWVMFDIQRLHSLNQRRKHFPRKKTTNNTSNYLISRVIDYSISLKYKKVENESEHLRLLRDRALIISLADTGLELSTLCDLYRSDIDLKNSRLEIRKGKKTTNLSRRASAALKDYITARSCLDEGSRRPPTSLPLFARHDARADKNIIPIQVRAAYNIIKKRAKEALGVGYDGEIKPISFRYYFSSSIMQSFASLHPRISQTCQVPFENALYDTAIFDAMKVVEEEVRSITSSDPTDVGINLITKTMQVSNEILFSSVKAEQESAYYLFRGAIGFFKNPLSHRTIDTSDPIRTLECLSLASLLMRMLEEAIIKVS